MWHCKEVANVLVCLGAALHGGRGLVVSPVWARLCPKSGVTAGCPEAWRPGAWLLLVSVTVNGGRNLPFWMIFVSVTDQMRENWSLGPECTLDFQAQIEENGNDNMRHPKPGWHCLQEGGHWHSCRSGALGVDY